MIKPVFLYAKQHINYYSYVYWGQNRNVPLLEVIDIPLSERV